jgi:hypothetical protein
MDKKDQDDFRKTIKKTLLSLSQEIKSMKNDIAEFKSKIMLNETDKPICNKIKNDI